MREPNTLQQPAGDAALLFRLEYKAHRPSSGVGTVVMEVAGLPTVIGPVYYNRDEGQYWGVVHTTVDTQLRDEPQQTLEDMVRLHLLGPLWQHHPTVAATFERAKQLRDAFDRTFNLQKDKGVKNPNRIKVVVEAHSEFQGALSALAYVLTAAGVNVAGHGGFPSADLALASLDRWIEAQK